MSTEGRGRGSSAASTSGEVKVDGKVVLVVDDCPETRELARLLLEEGCGVRVIVSTVGADALRQARRAKPSLVLLEIAPGHENLPVGKQLKADPATRSIPIVAFGFEAECRGKALEAGCDDWLGKPFDVDLLLSKVQHYLAKPTGQLLASTR